MARKTNVEKVIPASITVQRHTSALGCGSLRCHIPNRSRPLS